MKKILLITAAIALISTISITAFAATYSTPLDIAAGVTGKTTDQVATERASGKTYGAIAADAGKLEEFKAAKETMMKERLALLVKNGTITQAKADEILANLQARLASCDGTGNQTGGFGMGNSLGCITGTGGMRNGNGGGRGMGAGGRGLGSASNVG